MLEKCIAVLAIVSCGVPTLAHLPIDPSPTTIALQDGDCQPEAFVRDLNIDLVVDDSSSMAGFVRVAGGNYRRALSAITDPRVVSRLTIRSLNRPATPLRSSRDLYTEAFYRFNTTPLQNALTRTARDPVNVVTLLVSDLIQSQRDSDPRDATRALARALKAAPYAMLIGLSAPYHEDSRRCSPNCRPGTQRHFYLLALAHDRRYLRKFVTATRIDALADHRSAHAIRSGDGTGPTLFYSFAPVLGTSRIEIVGPRREDWSVVDRESTLVDCHAGLLQTPFVAFVTPRAPLAPALFVRINARVNATVDRVKVRPEVSQARIPAAAVHLQTVADEIVTPRHFTPLAGTGRTRWFELRVDGDVPNTNQWRIYRVRLYVPSDSVHPPWWVDEWMNEDPPTDGTLTLEAFVNEIIQAGSSEALLAEFWLGLSYEQLK